MTGEIEIPRRNELAEVVDVGFASHRWQSFIGKRRSKSGAFERRTLEVCVFVHLADALQTGDLYVVGAEPVSALHRDDELPLLWPIHSRHRSLLFRLALLCQRVNSALFRQELPDLAAECGIGFLVLGRLKYFPKDADQGFLDATLLVVEEIQLLLARLCRRIRRSIISIDSSRPRIRAWRNRASISV